MSIITKEKVEHQKYPMNPRVKKLWVEALRSGEYKQGWGFMQSDYAYNPKAAFYCCLGVLNCLYNKEHPTGEFGIYYLPQDVMKWAGISNNRGYFKSGEASYTSLSELNDNGKLDFNQIADVIEENF